MFFKGGSYRFIKKKKLKCLQTLINLVMDDVVY